MKKEIPKNIVAMNNCYVKSVIENEGLGYAITNYMGPNYVFDPHLKQLWTDAERVLTAIERYLEPYDENAEWDARDFDPYIEN